MNEQILEKRKSGQKTSNSHSYLDKIDLIGSREDFRLKLRKEKLEDFFHQRRTLFLDETNSTYEIVPHLLNIPESLRQMFLQLNPPHVVKNLLTSSLASEEIEVKKYGVNYLRKLLVNKELQINEYVVEETVILLLKIVDTSNDNQLIVRNS